MIQNFDNNNNTILILFSELKSEDFPLEIQNDFKYTEELKKKDKGYLVYNMKELNRFKKSKFLIYLIPFYFPIENLDDNLEDLTTYISERLLKERSDDPYIRDMLRFYPETDYSLKTKIKLNCFGTRTVEIPKIDINSYKSFIGKDFMKLLIQLCIINLKRGAKVNLINNFIFNTHQQYQFCGNIFPRAIRFSTNANIYLTQIPYFYPFISILSNYKNFSLTIGDNLENFLDNFKEVLNIVSYPRFFDINLRDRENLDWLEHLSLNKSKKGKSNLITNNTYLDYVSITLERNIITSLGSDVSIPVNSFSTAIGNRWLDSYAVIVGINNVIKKIGNDFSFEIMKKSVVLIPELQYEILQGNWDVIRENSLVNNSFYVFIPINTNSIHWSLLILDLDERRGYHFDSLKTNKKVNIKDISNSTTAYQIFKLIFPISDNFYNIELNNQYNNYDCGVFLLYHLEILFYKSLSDGDDFIRYIREYIYNHRDRTDLKIAEYRREIYRFIDFIQINNLNQNESKEYYKKSKKNKKSNNDEKKNIRKIKSTKIINKSIF